MPSNTDNEDTWQHERLLGTVTLINISVSLSGLLHLGTQVDFTWLHEIKIVVSERQSTLQVLSWKAAMFSAQDHWNELQTFL